MPRHFNIPVRKKPIINLPAKQKVAAPSPLEIETEKRIAEALQLHQSGNFSEAQKIYTEILNTQPTNFSALQLTGMVYLQTGQHQAAIDYLNKAIQVNPQFAACYINRGIALQALQRFDEALQSYDAAIRIQPDYVEAYSNRGVTLNALKQYDEALASYEKAITIKPTYADAYSNKGNTLHELKRYEEALICYQKALDLKPEFPDALLNQGNTLQDLKRFEEAITSYEKAITYKPDYAELYYSIGNASQELKRYGIALACYEKVIRLKPHFIDGHLNRGVVLQKLKRFEEALATYDEVLRLHPNYAKALTNRGVVLKDLKRFDEALASYDQAIKIEPCHIKAHSNRGLLLIQMKRFDDALEAYKTVIPLDPNDAQAYYDCGAVLHEQGKFKEAISFYRKALSIDPNHEPARNNILFVQSYTGISKPLDYLYEAKSWELGRLTNEQRINAKKRSFSNQSSNNRRLKIGYVSGDFNYHAVSYFTEAVFRAHNSSRVEVFAYYTNPFQDNITEKLKSLTEHWIQADDIPYHALLDRIKADGIDVLIDLSGFTAFNRMEVFAQRAAPVQAHYLGFTGSTGLTEMDYWIGDPILTPSHIQPYFSEQLWQLPRVWVSYKGDMQAPVTQWTPASDGSICIGGFNDLGKLTDATVELWAKTLHALPQAYLLLKTKKLGDIGNRQRVMERFESHGIAPERIELQDPSATPNWYDHLSYYDRLDICLDPYGAAGGGTTTCDALWMGAPIITLVKEDSPMASRMTASMLHAIGHPEWIAHSEAEYVDKVVELARNVEHRKNLRFTQRQKMAQSPLCDSKGLARALEDAYIAMFTKWYEKNQVETASIPVTSSVS